MSAFARLLTAASDLVFPPSCLLCQRTLLTPGASSEQDTDDQLCSACLAEITADLSRCGRCGTTSLSSRSGEPRCESCVRRPPPWRAMVVVSAYGDLLREAVVRSKRPAGEPLAAALGRQLARRVREQLMLRDLGPLDVVTAVPMHWRRRLARGTSAADTLAAVVARDVGLRHVRGLRRVRATTMQNALPPHERPANVRTAFRAIRHVRGKGVLLVDDVMTTGATASACTMALLAGGAREVYVAAVAKAERAEAVVSV